MSCRVWQKKNIVCVIALSFFVSGLSIKAGDAAEALFSKEANLIGGYSSEDRWVGEVPFLKEFAGFEYYRKFSGETGDFLTLDFQTRIAYDPSQRGSEAWGVEIHNAWLEYKPALGHYFKIGHFDPAFGLEPVLDTHGTLLQTLAMKDIGFKKDWGVSYRSFWRDWDYEIAAQAGSGMGLRKLGENFLLTGRIGLPASRPFRYGLSFLWGETLLARDMRTIPEPRLVSEKGIPKKRVGLDAQYEYGPYLFKSEVAFGNDCDKAVLGSLVELDYTVPSFQKLQFQLQGNSFSHDLGRGDKTDAQIVTGLSYQITSKLAFRVGYFGDLHRADGREDHRAVAQLYFFG